jgi:hypothetical protein
VKDARGRDEGTSGGGGEVKDARGHDEEDGGPTEAGMAEAAEAVALVLRAVEEVEAVEAVEAGATSAIEQPTYWPKACQEVRELMSRVVGMSTVVGAAVAVDGILGVEGEVADCETSAESVARDGVAGGGTAGGGVAGGAWSGSGVACGSGGAWYSMVGGKLAGVAGGDTDGEPSCSTRTWRTPRVSVVTLYILGEYHSRPSPQPATCATCMRLQDARSWSSLTAASPTPFATWSLSAASPRAHVV